MHSRVGTSKLVMRFTMHTITIAFLRALLHAWPQYRHCYSWPKANLTESCLSVMHCRSHPFFLWLGHAVALNSPSLPIFFRRRPSGKVGPCASSCSLIPFTCHAFLTQGMPFLRAHEPMSSRVVTEVAESLRSQPSHTFFNLSYITFFSSKLCCSLQLFLLQFT